MLLSQQHFINSFTKSCLLYKTSDTNGQQSGQNMKHSGPQNCIRNRQKPL